MSSIDDLPSPRAVSGIDDLPPPPGPSLAQKAKKGLETYVVDQLPALGGAAGGLIGGALGLPEGGVGAAPMGMAGAGLGGYTGKALQNLYNSQFRPELAPKDMTQVIAEPLAAG